MTEADLEIRVHRASSPTVVRRRGELRRAAALLRERYGGFVRGRRSRARRTLVHRLATTLDTSYAHARHLFERMREQGLVRFDERRRGLLLAKQRR